MGASSSSSSSKSPAWYPGEPSADVSLGHGYCYYGDAHSSGKKVERNIATLPVVELVGMKFIAQGAFCAVFACKYRGLSVVAKRVREDLPLPTRQQALANLWDEFECLRPLSHPNVIEAYGLCRVRCRKGYDDWNEKDVCLLLEELALGTVGHLFGTIYTVEKNLASAMARSRKMKMIPFRCRLDRVLELARALQYVHGGSGLGVMMHRDIKSANVGFAHNGSLKLMDFGLSKMAPPGLTGDDTFKMTGEVGSYRYMAPELVKHQPYNVKVDIYSWAIFSWEVLAIDRPYSWATDTTFVARVVTGGERPELHKSWPDRLCKLLASAWHTDHAKRPTAAQLVAELVVIKAELPAKYRRQRPIVTAPSPGDGGGGGGSGGNRRHSWTPQASSSLIDADDRTRPASGAAHDHGTSMTPQLQPAVSLPLPLISSSSSFSSQGPRRWSIASAKRPSRPGKTSPLVAEVGTGGEAGATGPGGAGTRRSEPKVGAQRKGRRRRRSISGAASTADSVAEDEESENQHDGRRGPGKLREAGDAGGTTGTTTTTDNDGGGRRQPLHRRRNSRQREIITEALAREASAEAERPRGAGRRRTRTGDGGQTSGQRGGSRAVVGEEGRTQAEEEAEVGETVGRFDAVAAAVNKQTPPRAREHDGRGSSTSRRQSGPPRDDSGTTSARVRHMPSPRHAAETRGDSAGTRSCDNNGTAQNGTVSRSVTVIGVDGGERGGAACGGEREKREGANSVMLSSDQTSLLGTVAKKEEADEEDDEDEATSGGGGRGVRRNSSLDKLWPALPTGYGAEDGPPRRAPFRTGAVRVAPEPAGEAAPTAVRAGGLTSEKEENIFAMLGAPRGVGSAEAIEERLALLRGTLSMPRA